MFQNDKFRPLLTTSLNGLNRTVVFSTEKKKTVSVVFSRKAWGFPNPELFIGRSLIKVANEFKFLGLIFDRSLRFHRHLKDLKIRSAKALNILKVLANTLWGAD
ncbi:hypothetical protein TNIN_133991 [Trichonephila inaurata madagascariensis]|uniref:Uncharacterized protein n=1 Tax=Trichonephila inaurata madagascariensis TaxID=2747483 RepID=A0A8X7CF84_9ARAC|nr:hypothetical protein TNIN_133991 [Trichonephila inaurata madagascariensis]